MALEIVTPSAEAAAEPPNGFEPTELDLCQIRVVFEEIADAASRTDRHIFYMPCEFLDCEDDRAAIELSSLRDVIKKLGWLADLGLSKLTGQAEVKGGAEDWLMPPVFTSNSRKN